MIFKMKRILLIGGLICLIILSLTGCNILPYTIGTGKIVDKTYDLRDFNEVEFSNAFEFEINQSDSYSVTVSTYENLIGYLDIHQSGKTLIVSLTPGSFTNSYPKAKIMMPDLNGLECRSIQRQRSRL